MKRSSYMLRLALCMRIFMVQLNDAAVFPTAVVNLLLYIKFVIIVIATSARAATTTI